MTATSARAGHLATRSVTVDGLRVSFATGGSGLPVLFLHGWGLDHRPYQRSLRRLTERGCRVVAPTLPGFGDSDPLPRTRPALADYATWVRRFLEAIEIAEPVVALGHSFGGGIATKLAHDHSGSVRYLVLINSVGDAHAFPRRQMRDTLRLDTDGWATSGLVQRALLENLLRRPAPVLHAARVALSADLHREMSTLAERHLPVLVLWSDGDGVIPSQAFDTFCSTFGTDGRVVHGGHSWLLADPDAFGEVLDNVIQMQRAEHGQRTATATIATLRALLEQTTVPARMTSRLLADLSPLWLLSETPVVLAGDLALCHPRLAPSEMRAVAREMPAANTFRLTVVAADRPGLLADTAATLAGEGISILSASATTWPDDHLALHAMTVHSTTAFSTARWNAIGERLQTMVHRRPAPIRFVPTGQAQVTRTGESDGKCLVRVTAPDRLGLLAAVCRWFADNGASIEAAHVATIDGVASDVFLLDRDCDTTALAAHLSARRVLLPMCALGHAALAGAARAFTRSR